MQHYSLARQQVSDGSVLQPNEPENLCSSGGWFALYMHTPGLAESGISERLVTVVLRWLLR